MKKSFLSAVALITVAAPVSAELEFRGFASIVAGMTTDKDDYNLYGYDDNLSFKEDSLFAIQAESNLGEGLSATTQILARGVDDFDATMEWAYITYQLNDEWKVNAGKLRTPFYRYSDFLDVGFSYNWVKPPQTVYNLGFSTYEGVSLINNGNVMDFDYQLQGILGSFDNDGTNVENLVGVNLTLDYDEWLSFRTGYIVGEEVTFDASLGSLEAVLDAYQLDEAKSDLLADGDTGAFFGIGGKIDYNNWLVEAEYTELEVENSVLAVQKRMYLTLGHRFNEYLVHATFEKAEDESNDAALFHIPFELADGTPIVIPLPDGSTPYLNTFVDENVISNPSSASLSNQEAVSLGIRYDFRYNAALKAQITSFEQDNRDRDATLLRFGIDLMF